VAKTDNRRMAARRRAVMRKVKAGRADALLVTREEDVGYLSGFTGEDSFLLLARGRAALLTDGRYGEQARRECAGLEVIVRDGAMSTVVARAVKERGIRRLAVQSEDVTLLQREMLAKRLCGCKLVSMRGVVSGRRTVKDQGEIAAIRKAIRVAERAFRKLLAAGAEGLVGRSENDLAGELEYLMRLEGASAASFETIVAVGPHSSLPHHRPGKARIRRDQVVLIDWGAEVDGYCSDLTRVVAVGRIPPKLADVYEVVLRAQQAGIDAIRPGVATGTPDGAARAVIESAGYAAGILHSLGHGIGREVHEPPGLGRAAKAGRGSPRLRSGMVVTVEPGVYLPGLGGVRIEDDVLVTPGGARRLSTLPRSLKAMTLE